MHEVEHVLAFFNCTSSLRCLGVTLAESQVLVTSAELAESTSWEKVWLLF